MNSALTVKRVRIHALDMLRGLFLIIIISDHLGWRPSLLFQIATLNTFWVASAAEGFFVISGILVGYVYGPRMVKNARHATVKLIKRAGLLYCITVASSFFYLTWSLLSPQPYPRLTWVGGFSWQQAADFLTLKYSYGWTDFLAYYAVFMLFAPLVLWLIVKGRAWLAATLSIITWAILPAFNVFTPYSGWQVIFMISIIIGFYLPTIEQWARSLPQKRRRIATRAIITTACVSFASIALWSIFVVQIFDTSFNHAFIPNWLYIILQKIELARQWLLPAYFDRGGSLGIGRIAVGIVWFSALYITFRTYEAQLTKITKGILYSFGQNSLLVFVLHGFVIFAMDSIIAPPSHPTNLIILNTVINIGVIALIYYIIRHKHLFVTLRSYQRKAPTHEAP